MLGKQYDINLINLQDKQSFHLVLLELPTLEQFGPLLARRLALPIGNYLLTVDEPITPEKFSAYEKSPKANNLPIASRISDKITLTVTSTLKGSHMDISLPEKITVEQIAPNLSNWLKVQQGEYKLTVENHATHLIISVTLLSPETPTDSITSQLRFSLPQTKQLSPDMMPIISPNGNSTLFPASDTPAPLHFDWSAPEENSPSAVLAVREPLYAQVTVRSGSLIGQKFILKKGETNLGRAGESEIAFMDEEISREHARVIFRDNQYILEDRQSRNGTFINQKRLLAPQALQNGDVIWLGPQVILRYKLVYRPSDADEDD
jgi:hypothetical protein